MKYHFRGMSMLRLKKMLHRKPEATPRAPFVSLKNLSEERGRGLLYDSGKKKEVKEKTGAMSSGLNAKVL